MATLFCAGVGSCGLGRAWLAQSHGSTNPTAATATAPKICFCMCVPSSDARPQYREPDRYEFTFAIPEIRVDEDKAAAAGPGGTAPKPLLSGKCIVSATSRRRVGVDSSATAVSAAVDREGNCGGRAVRVGRAMPLIVIVGTSWALDDRISKVAATHSLSASGRGGEGERHDSKGEKVPHDVPPEHLYNSAP